MLQSSYKVGGTTSVGTSKKKKKALHSLIGPPIMSYPEHLRY